MSQKYTRATAIQTINAGKLLEAHCKSNDGIAQYEEGWSDQKIATETGAPLSMVQTLRREMVGNIIERGASTSNVRLDMIETRLTNVENVVAQVVKDIEKIFTKWPSLRK